MSNKHFSAFQSVSRSAIFAAIIASAGTASAGVNSWVSPVDGFWDVGANWSTGIAPGTLDSASIAVAGTYTATIRSGIAVEELSISNVNAILDIQNARALTIASATAATAPLVNDGMIVINSNQGTSTTQLQVGDADTAGMVGAEIGQTGEIILNVAPSNGDLSDAILNIQGNGLHAANHTVRGKGRVSGTFTNDGVILADRIDGELRISGDVTQSAGGIVRATAGGVLGIGDNGIVRGGMLLTDTDGRIRLLNGTLMGGAHNFGDVNVLNNTTMRIDAGGITNDGTITLNSNQGTSFTQIVVVADTSILGTGIIDLNVFDVNSDINDATLTTDLMVTVSNGPDHKITGKGRVSGTWINNGAIEADRDGQELRISGDVVQSATGSIRAINNGVLGIGDNGRVSGGSVITGTGGSVQTTNGTGTIDGGITNQGDMGVRNNTALAIGPGGVVNNGTITVNSNEGTATTNLLVIADATISGSGSVDLNVFDINSDLTDARLITDAGVTATIGASQTVTGKGRVEGTFINNGTINADRTGQDLHILGTIAQGPGGTIKGTGGGFAGLLGVAITGGFFDSDTGGAVLAVGGVNSISGVTGLGASGLRNNTGMSILAGGFTNDGVCTVNSNSGTAGTILTVAENATIDGTGQIDLNVFDANGDFNDAQLVTAAGVIATNAASHTVSGKGKIAGDWINQGTIAADRPGQDLQVIGTFDQTSGGVIRGDNAGAAVLSGAAVTGGTFDSSLGGSVLVQGAGNSISGVNSLNAAGLRNGARLDILAPGLTNNGVLTVNVNQGTSTTAITVTADAMIDGTGTIHFGISPPNGDYNDAQLGAADGSTLTIGPDQTVTGKGRLFGDVVLEGTLAPGSSIDTIRMNTNGVGGSLTMTQAAEYTVEASAEEVNDRLDATVPVVIAGTLRFTPIEGFDPPRPTRYTIMTGPDFTGTFDTLIYDGVIPEGGVFRVVYEDTEVIAAVTCKADIAAPIGVLDLSDITLFTKLFLMQSPLVDLAPPMGVLDLSDINTFVIEFLAGCSN